MSPNVFRSIVVPRARLVLCASGCLIAIVVTGLGCRGQAPGDADSPRATPARADRRPNILLIVADDMGYTDVGFMGGEIATPNLDALANAGLRFTNFHAGSSCGPTRAMLMSGRTNREVGVAGPDAVLAPDITTLPELLKQAGYHTYMAGKWHIGHEPAQGPAAQGFESSFALVRAGDNHLGPSNWW
jgi:arylsulfatase